MRDLFGRSWLILVFAFLYLPIGCLVVFSFTAGELTTQLDGVSLRWYASLAGDAELRSAVALSLTLACAAASAAVLIGGVAALGLRRFGPLPGRGLLAAMLSVPMVLPEVVIGLSLVLLFTHPWLPWLGGRGVVAIWVAHTTLCVAYVTVLVDSRLAETDPALEEAARVLGCPPLKACFVITVPVIVPALLSGWLLAFTLSMDDFVLAGMLSDPGSTTLPVLVFARLHHGLKPDINALASVIVALVSIAVLIFHVLQRSSRRRERARALRREG
ncbi:ABC transporter permease subunit [Niveibacterium terrae]|uniref:ABC transporter permease subunit n=1 Tax=Niveibacterium terrae TaxID=3373598 RepID=UPI003A8DBC3D